MSKIFTTFAAVMVTAALTVGLSSCNKDDVTVPASDAGKGVVARAAGNGGSYSDYIITPQEAMDMVANDLKKSGGEFAKKQVESVEPVIISGIQQLLDPELFDCGLIVASDPAFYIVHFQKDDGYVLLNPDKIFGGPTIVSVQTEGTISADDFYNFKLTDVVSLEDWLDQDAQMSKLPVIWSQGDVWTWINKHSSFGDFGIDWWHKYYDDLYEINTDIAIKLLGMHTADVMTVFRRSSGSSNLPIITVDSTEWTTIKDNNIPSELLLLMSSNSALNSYVSNYQMGSAAPTILNFIGFFGGTTTLFGQTGNWSAIKNDYSTAPAPYWAWSIDQYCSYNTQICNEDGNCAPMVVKDSPTRALMFLQSNGYPNAEMKIYSCSGDQQMNGAISNIIASQRPVIIFTKFNGVALAYREEVQEKTISCTISYSPVTFVQSFYRSRISYYTGNGEDRKSINSYFNNTMSYIAY